MTGGALFASLGYVAHLHMRIASIKSGAFHELRTQFIAARTEADEHADAVVAKNADDAAPKPLRLPRTSVRDPLPPGVHSISYNGPELPAGTEVDRLGHPLTASFGKKPHRLTAVGRLKMQATHPRYSDKTHKTAIGALAAMGLDKHGKPKRKAK